jgi:hypothetical protein
VELGVGWVENKTGYARTKKNKRLKRERIEKDVKCVYVYEKEKRKECACYVGWMERLVVSRRWKVEEK